MTLEDQNFPAVYRAADKSSLRSQRQFLMATRLRLAGMVGAAFFGLFVWRAGASPVDWAGVAAVVAFLLAMLVEVYILTTKPERTWYECRAVAESVKTLTWRYMMCASPFGHGAKPPETDELFLRRVGDVLNALKELDLGADPVGGHQITEKMRSTRAASLEDRKSIYDQQRVSEQQRWYARNATWNREHATRWTIVMLVVEALGVTAAILKAVGTITGDLLGLAGAAVAAMTAWLQTKQHRTLATAYAVTALELASVKSRITSQASEGDWAAFVADAEEAFSREHTLWKASRGVRAM